MSDYLPHSDGALEEWTRGFVQGVLPQPEAFGLGVAQVAELDAAQRAFAAALRVTNSPTTRTMPAVTHKDTLRRAMIPLFRRAAQAVQAHPQTTNLTRTDLGLTLRRKRVRMAAVPAESPMLTVTSLAGAQVRMHLGQWVSGRRGRPTGSKGATWFYCVSKAMPEPTDWVFGGNTIETGWTVTLPGVSPGATVWFTACWINERLTMGPLCPAVSTQVAGGFVSVLSDSTVKPVCVAPVSVLPGAGAGGMAVGAGEPLRVAA